MRQRYLLSACGSVWVKETKIIRYLQSVQILFFLTALKLPLYMRMGNPIEKCQKLRKIDPLHMDRYAQGMFLILMYLCMCICEAKDDYFMSVREKSVTNVKASLTKTSFSRCMV